MKSRVVVGISSLVAGVSILMWHGHVQPAPPPPYVCKDQVFVLGAYSGSDREATCDADKTADVKTSLAGDDPIAVVTCRCKTP